MKEMIKAFILDLDNTIYPVSSIGKHCLPFYLNFIFNRMLFRKTIQPFPSYAALKKLPGEKYLVTDGMTKLQQTKIRQLAIEADFKSIYIIDPSRTPLTKKDIFEIIMLENGYRSNELLVIGDDLKSEIRFAKELGIPAVLFEANTRHIDKTDVAVIRSFDELKNMIY